MGGQRGWIIGLGLFLYTGAILAGLFLGLPRWALDLALLLPLLAFAAFCVGELRTQDRAISDLNRRGTDLNARTDRLSRELSSASAQLRALEEPVLFTDSAGRIAACNPAAEKLLALRADRLLGRPAEEAFTRADLLGLYERARAGERVREQVRIARPEGNRVWDVSAGALIGQKDEPPGVLMCPRDITDAALALRVRADFVANASHELRTPIAAMRIALDTLPAPGPEDDAMRERLEGIIASNVARLEEMARDLLDLSRLESVDAPPASIPINLADLARELHATYEPACNARRLTLTFDIPPEVARLRSDPKLLNLILSNLIDNAAKFAFEGTEIRVTARGGPAVSSTSAVSFQLSALSQANATNAVSPQLSALGQANPVPAPALADSRKLKADSSSPLLSLRLEISDRGIGIPLDQQQRIFERFYQVDAARTPGRPRRGTGLGLAIVKHAVRSLGGTIRVQSVWQQGTTMIVELPECAGG